MADPRQPVVQPPPGQPYGPQPQPQPPDTVGYGMAEPFIPLQLMRDKLISAAATGIPELIAAAHPAMEHPLETTLTAAHWLTTLPDTALRAVIGGTKEQIAHYAEQAKQAWQRGDWGQAGGYGLQAATAPVTGGTAEIAQRLTTPGQQKRGLGNLISLAGTALLPMAFAPKAKAALVARSGERAADDATHAALMAEARQRVAGAVPQPRTPLTDLAGSTYHTEGSIGNPKDFGLWSYDNVEEALKDWQNKGTPDQLLAHLKKSKGSIEEADTIGLSDWLKGKKSVTKQEVQDFVNQNKVQLQETWLGELGPNEKARLDELNQKLMEGSVSGPALTSAERDEYNALTRREQFTRTGGQASQYAQYTEPGGKNYRELLIQAQPGTTGPYTSPHWQQPNVLAHVRMDDRTLPDGRKVLFVEEIQSDWHQAGRKKGYAVPGAATAAQKRWNQANQDYSDFINNYAQKYGTGNYEQAVYNDLQLRLARTDTTTPEGMDLWRASQDFHHIKNEIFSSSRDLEQVEKAVPNAPFKDQSWKKLALKRVMKYAADNGYDGVAWTPGSMQNARYKLSNTVDGIRVWANGPESRRVQIDLKNAGPIALDVDEQGQVTNSAGYGGGGHFVGQHLSDVLGKEMSDRIAQAPRTGAHFEGQGLDIGGSGMKGFYDQELPNLANDLFKKHGVRVGKEKLPSAAEDDFRVGRSSESNRVIVRRNGVHVASFDTPDEAWQYVDQQQAARAPSVHYIPVPADLKSKKLPLFMVGGAAAGTAAAASSRKKKGPDLQPPPD